MAIILEKICIIIIYFVMGIMFRDITESHVTSLEKKVSKIDDRFVEKLRIHIRYKKPTQMKFYMTAAILWIFWPITVIAVIFKAEDEYSIIKHHWTIKGRVH